ncbi:MAG: hypothetical protein NWT08_09220 [Akkermansiaceae bacterium]|nr:hypothetical protein [Akkermansiaceae bacterium]MDP4646958.1 hypothetical protein [Akkermansiaceae bacterium]MDP4720619.1 hypothetical protein [Akkermansiaceae bacterium]MDP4780189.1 hypothetical protein [Akkermansiaceae bacterium]MDP4847563.1 hypothetical protein [Akkermansiaceae bacterium]
MKSFIIIPFIAFSLVHAAEPTVTLAGIQVVFDDGEKDFDGFKTFNMSKGHNAALIVRSVGKTMVDFDDDKATITLGGAKTDCSFFSNMAFSDDRLALKLEFKTTDPVKMDTDGNIKIEGSLPVTLATGKAETRSAPFEAKVGSAVKFPGDDKEMPAIEIKSIRKSDYEDDVYEIEFSTNRRIDDYAGFLFYTKDGKLLEADRGGSSWMGGFGGSKGSGEFSYRFKAKPTDLILAVETWTGREQITLKVDLTAGLALP